MATVGIGVYLRCEDSERIGCAIVKCGEQRSPFRVDGTILGVDLKDSPLVVDALGASAWVLVGVDSESDGARHGLLLHRHIVHVKLADPPVFEDGFESIQFRKLYVDWKLVDSPRERVGPVGPTKKHGNLSCSGVEVDGDLKDRLVDYDADRGLGLSQRRGLQHSNEGTSPQVTIIRDMDFGTFHACGHYS